MPSHARPKPSRVPRGVLRAGLVISAAGAALTGGAAAASAAAPMPGGAAAPHQTASEDGVVGHAVARSVTGSTSRGLGPVKDLKLDPMNNTGVDPLDNGLGTQVADFKPVSTKQVTDPVTKGGSLRSLPVTGTAMGLLPG
ncbi:MULTISPECIES: hypothetical protein [Streptomyces]|uniref:hypothetical protein n=1 Tax=Streptomyces TaxID=1883 RepID=UPI001964C3A9|nr:MULTISPECIES: hypothetical protein [Streptomyces]QRX93959.1 hypothetical protein JNO44_26755 [Streptomyces noursei]UJB43677.1 hypothetical protein HRD51_25335 [Streptomyces sp. A1-5]